jgi:hypothetical protein
MERTMRLLVSNVPAACPDDFVKDWVEAHGYRTFGVRLIRDTVSGTSPSFAYVQLMDSARLDEAARALDGKILWGAALQVRRVVPPASVANSVTWLRAVG